MPIEDPKYRAYHAQSSWPPVIQPKEQKRYGFLDSSNKLALPYTELRTSLVEALNKRKSSKKLVSDGKTNQAELGTFLKWSAGKSETREQFRYYPSAGQLYLNQIFVHIHTVAGLESGWYGYNADEHSLVNIDISFHANDAMVQNDMHYHYCVIVAADLKYAIHNYGERGYRFSLLEAGHIVQNMMLVAASLDKGIAPIGGFDDKEINRHLRIGEDRFSTLYLIPIGEY